MQLRLTDPAYTERLASFLGSLGQEAVVEGPDRIELLTSGEVDAAAHSLELTIYLRVWQVLYPDAEVKLESAFDE